MDSYEEVFKDYPYVELFNSLENGRVDLNTNSVEIGEIYLIVKKYRYFKDESEDLSVVKKILTQQLKTMFSPPYKRTTSETLNLGRLPNGLVIMPLDTLDTFIISCWGSDYGYRRFAESGRVGESVKFNDDREMFFNYVNLHNLYDEVKGGGIVNEWSCLRIFQSDGESWEEYLKNMCEWGYIFKIPIDSPMNQFINWTSNPFI